MTPFLQAALPHAADTVQKLRVVAPLDLRHAADTLSVRLVGQVQTAQTGVDWGTWIMAAATVALVGVTVYSYMRSQRLNERLARLQQRHEKERREAERRATRNRQLSVRARASGAAYALQGQLQSWLDDAPDTVDAVVASYDGLAGDKEAEGFVQDLMPQHVLIGCVQWINAHSGDHFDRAEQRVQQLLQDAPELEERTATAVRRAFVRFYRGTRRMNRVALAANTGDKIPAAAVAQAYHDLEGCITLLNEVIGEELLGVTL